MSTPFLNFLNKLDSNPAFRKKIYNEVLAVFKGYDLSPDQVRVLLAGDRDGIYIEATYEWEKATGGGTQATGGGKQAHARGKQARGVGGLGIAPAPSSPTPMHTCPPDTWGG